MSLDSLDDDAFRAMNDVDFPVQRVLDGIDAAAAAGLPVKVNAVVKRGVNDAAVVELAEHFRGTGHVLRFIEFMDVGTTNGWRLEDVVTADEIVERIGERWPLEPVAAESADATARRYRYADGAGEIGVIASVTKPFCGALLAGAPLGRGPPLHVPLRGPRPRPPRPAPERRDRRGARRDAPRHLVAAHRPLLRAPHRRDRGEGRKSRCRT